MESEVEVHRLLEGRLSLRNAILKQPLPPPTQRFLALINEDCFT